MTIEEKVEEYRRFNREIEENTQNPNLTDIEKIKLNGVVSMKQLDLIKSCKTIEEAEVLRKVRKES